MVSNYRALAYLTRTGAVLGELPLAFDPPWTQLINDAGSWTIWAEVAMKPGDTGLSRDKLLEWIDQEWKISVAIVYGNGSPNDPVCQAGPLIASTLYNLSENPPIVQLGGRGLFGLFAKRYQVASGWNGASVAAGGGADTSYTSSLQGIAVGILNNMIARDTLPVDVPAAITGSNVRNYFGYDFVSAGQRLQELTQVQNGPDILLQPYLTSSGSVVRHQALIGNPTLGNPTVPLYFDYPGTISSIVPTRDATNMASGFYAKGNGMEYATIWGWALDPTLTGQGWPLLEGFDSTHSDVIDSSTIFGWAQGDIALYGRSLETWVARCRMDANPKFGTYTPGVSANYTLRDHPMKRDGQYSQRIIGFQALQGDPVGEVRHLLQSQAGEI